MAAQGNAKNIDAALFAEAIHTVVDTGNQALPLFGLARAKRPAPRLTPPGPCRSTERRPSMLDRRSAND